MLLGAAILSGCARQPVPTFTRDVAPILYASCVSCHRPGEVAPFSLLEYADAAKHATKIAEETQERHMPPWLPAAGEFPIAGERRLRDDQIDVIQRWVKAGMPEGDRNSLPAPPAFPDGWQLGTPDAVLVPERPYTL